jgi:neutral ceramidase
VNRRDFLKRNAMAGIALGIAGSAAGEAAAPAMAAPVDSPTLVPEHFGQVDLGANEQLLKIGFAERDITPDIGMEYPGNYFPTYLTAFHDPCKVRAAVFDDGKTKVVLVGTDSVMIPRSVVEAARKQIQQRCGIAPESVMIGAAHNHSGGPVVGEPGLFDHAPELIQRLAYKESPSADPGYLKLMADQIANAVCQADEGRIEAWCGSESGMEDKVGFTRRFHMKNGFTHTHPGQGNPDIVSPAGPIDPQVGVIGAWDTNGRFLGCVVNYTCHATTNPGSGSEVSANWIYYMERVIRGAMGSSVPVVFLQGAAGNVTQVDNLSPYKSPKTTPWAEFVGGRIGAEAVKVLLTMVPGSLVPLRAESTVFPVKRRVPSAEHVRKAYDLIKHDPTPAERTEWLFAKETVLLDYLLKSSPSMPVEVQAIQIGPSVFVSNPGELFCQAGLDIKAGSHFPQTRVVSYANGAVGYVPTEDSFGPHGGGYETRLSSHTNLEPTASSQIVKAGLELIAKMRPGSVPVPEKALPFSTEPVAPGPHAWNYGNLPPQLD